MTYEELKTKLKTHERNIVFGIGAILVVILGWVLREKLSQIATDGHQILVGLVFLGLFFSAFAAFFREEEADSEETDRETKKDVRRVLGIFGIFFFLGLLLTTSIAGYLSPSENPYAFRSACLWALAFTFSGFAVGFLFGIPKVLQSGNDEESEEARERRDYKQRVNTNLEQISDWLTKIIVGVGLVELRSVPGLVDRLSKWAGASFPSATPEEVASIASFVGSIFIFFSILGFLGGYLVTRLFLAGAFERAEKQAQEPSKTIDYREDNLSDRIRSFWLLDGREIPDRRDKIDLWLHENGLDSVSIVELTTDANLAEQRKKIIADLVIP